MTPAQRGLALLAERAPAGWLEKLDPGELDVGSICQCPLSQVYGGYTRGAKALFLAAGLIHSGDDGIRELAISHGFEARGENDDPRYHAALAALTQEWRELITEAQSWPA